MEATYTKLKSGDWGVRVTGGVPQAGAPVTVSKRDGSTKIETVEKVLWMGEGASLCAITQTARAPRISGYVFARTLRRGW